VNNSLITGNAAISAYGGGVDNVHGGKLTMTGSTVSNNSAALGDGGGIDNFQGSSANLTNDTISGNRAALNGGGIASVQGSPTISLTNVTLSQNTASGSGGGLYSAAGEGQLGNTIIAANSSPIGPDVDSAAGTLSDSGYNLIGVGDGVQFVNGQNHDLVGTSANPLNPLLGPLQNNGGSVPTMALLPGSPAIDAGTSTGAPTADQRGINRVGATDIGAFESRGFNITITGGNQQAIANSAFASPLSVQVTSAYGEPVQGSGVTFSAPASGASAALSTPLTLNAAGQTSVSATANGTVGSFSVSASARGAALQSFSLTNLPAIILTPVTLSGGTYGTTYNTQTFLAGCGAGGPYTYTVASGALPDGLTLAPGGALTGMPTAAGTFTFTVGAQDSGGFTTSQSYTVTIDPATLTVTADN
jgi:predicted outer membrane repeat protein